MKNGRVSLLSKFFIFIILVIIILTLLHLSGIMKIGTFTGGMGKVFSVAKGILPEGELSQESKLVSAEIIVPPKEVRDFCVVQQFSIKDGDEFVRSDGIIGYDNINQCCVKEIMGVDACLKKDVVEHLCFTSLIGGKITYFTINGYLVEFPNDYQDFISNVHKNENFNCVKQNYPSVFLTELQNKSSGIYS